MQTEPGRLSAVDTVALNDTKDAAIIIDQRLLPGKIELLSLRTAAEFRDAIYTLAVRGAPAIGVCAAMGVYLSALAHLSDPAFDERLTADAETIASARPTAVNLRWAVRRMMEKYKVVRAGGGSSHDVKDALLRECTAIRDEDVDVCRRIGENGLSLLRPGMGILTHCNAGRLATVRYGTATAPIYLGQERGYGFSVYADETRPLLQGARLTAFELADAGVNITLQCDNMSASLMREGKIDAIFVGCDRVAANGDVANKIGTSMVALAAKRYGVPFYVCAPLSTVDLATKTGADIPIEQRAENEVTELWYRERMTARGVGVYNPAFDVTDADLVTAIVTEKGIAKAPYDESLRALFEENQD